MDRVKCRMVVTTGNGSCLTGKEFQFGKGNKVLETEVMGTQQWDVQNYCSYRKNH